MNQKNTGGIAGGEVLCVRCSAKVKFEPQYTLRDLEVFTATDNQCSTAFSRKKLVECLVSLGIWEDAA